MLICYGTYATLKLSDFDPFSTISRPTDFASLPNSFTPLTMGLRNLREAFTRPAGLQQEMEIDLELTVFPLADIGKLSVFSYYTRLGTYPIAVSDPITNHG